MNGNQSHGNNVFVFFERMTPIAGKEEEVLAITLKSAKSLEGQPGLIQSIVTRSQGSDGRLQSMSMWNSKA